MLSEMWTCNIREQIRTERNRELLLKSRRWHFGISSLDVLYRPCMSLMIYDMGLKLK